VTGLSGHFQRRSTAWWAFVILQSVFLGASISAIGVWLFVLIWHRSHPIGLAVNIIIRLAVFVVSFCVQVCQMPLHSPSESIVSDWYRKYLVDSLENYDLKHSTIAKRAADLMRAMFALGSETGSSGSRLWSWPFMTGRWTVL
jgi:hypothetical protein